jgi:methylated-DNA-[protein]-cysteine S-methyltransferase
MAEAALDVRTVSTPVGEIALIGGPAGVCRTCFPGEDPEAALVNLAQECSDGSLDPARVAREGAEELDRFFAGELRQFSVPVDLGPLGGFRRRVLDEAASIPFGETASYREMAIAAGSPGAVRAAGTAMGQNPVPLLVPCHRVIRSDGSPGLYGGGEEIKRWLLAFEAGQMPEAE